MLEDVEDGQDSRSGFGEAAGLAAIAAVRVRTHQSVPTLQPEDWDGETGQWGMEDLEASRDHLHYSEDTVQVDIQEPLDSVDRHSDDVGAESVADQTARCSALLDSPGLDKDLDPASGGQHSRKGWMGGNHLLNIDPVLGCRHHGHLDNPQALPVDCTEAEHLIPRDRCLHSVLWSETEDTSSVKGSLDTEEHPWCYSSFRCYFPSYKSRASQTSDLAASDDDASPKRVHRQPSRHLP